VNIYLTLICLVTVLLPALLVTVNVTVADPVFVKVCVVVAVVAVDPSSLNAQSH
jgi:hypothetical protein